MSVVVDVVVAICTWVGACVLTVLVGFAPFAAYGKWLERRPRTAARGHMPAHYEQVRRELLADRLPLTEACDFGHHDRCFKDWCPCKCHLPPVDKRDVDLWGRQIREADTDTIIREAAP